MKTSRSIPGCFAAAVLGACLCPASLGCALTSKADPLVVRYFSPELADGVTKPPGGHASTTLELRLGHVEHASYLDERMVYRDSTYEVGYYEERRWTEAPDAFLKRELNRVLFEERGVRRVVGGAAPTLEVELSAFEEVRAPAHVARVEVTARLQDQRVVRWMDTFTVDQPIVERPGDTAPAAVAALGKALRAVVVQIADRALAALAMPPPAEAASGAAQK